MTIDHGPSFHSADVRYVATGGPNFVGAEATETNFVAAITITGDVMCRATNVDYRLDTPSARVGPVGSGVLAFVGVDLGGPAAPPPSWRTDRRDVLHDHLEHGGVVDVGGGHHRGQRQPAIVADQVELASRLATIDGICAHLVPPRLARTLMVSTLARDQSTRPCSPRRSRTTTWS